MDLFHIILIITALLCTLVAGILVAFTVVVMPGIKTLNDGNFIQSFQVMDRIIQNGQPIFIMLWVGSVLFILVSAIWGIAVLSLTETVLLVMGGLFYLVGVQLPTATVNVPLNNRLQKVDTNVATKAELQTARDNFEQRWVKWNIIRTMFAVLTSLLLLVVILLQ